MQPDTYKKIVDSLNVGITVLRFDNINDPYGLRSLITNNAGLKAIRADATRENIQNLLVIESTPALRETGMIEQWADLLKKGVSTDMGKIHYPGDTTVSESWFSTKFHPLSEDAFYLEYTNISEQIEVEEKLKSSLEETTRMNAHMIGRELKMVELKEELRRLKETLDPSTPST